MSTSDHRSRARGHTRLTHAGGRTRLVLELGKAAEPVLGEILKRARTHRGLTLRDVEQRTGIPNPHLSQIERGQIKRPDAKILWELCELYLLNYARLAEWGGYLEQGTSRDSNIVALALRMFSKLDHEDQIEALRYLESLERRSRLEK
jgi:transcriptional regulator with XRE-family HTH domain